MFKIWNHREKPDLGSLAWKVLLVLGIVGLGVGAQFLRRRVKVRIPRSELKIGHGRARARLQLHVTRRADGSARGRRRAAVAA